ncbi:GNAT family N-acetyltransferase [Neobacillus mesonae]|nr:GNAT family N-acetyltransferase [Neobacillus mesonae]
MYKAYIDENTHMSILEERHSEDLFNLVNNSRDSITQWLEFPNKTKCVEDTKVFIRKSLNRFANNNGYWAGIWYRKQIVGSIGLLYIDWDTGRTEIGYWLGSTYEGMGLMTKACNTMITHAFNDLDLHKVEIGVATNNTKSRAIPERLGFTQEGVIRSYEVLHNQFHDRVIYGMLKEEWATIHPTNRES